MFRSIYRQRRRHLCAAFFAFLTTISFLLSAPSLWMIPDMPVFLSAITLVLTGLVVGALSAGISVLLVFIMPSMRNMVEMVAVFTFLQVSLSPFMPEWIVVYGVEWLLWLAVLFIIICTTYGTVLDRFRIWLDHAETRRFEVEGTPEELWDWLVPGLARAGGANWEVLLKKMEERAEEPKVFDVEYRIGHAQFEHQIITYETVSYPFHAEYTFQGELNPANRNLVQGTMSFTIAPLDGTGCCRITLTRTRKSLLVREGLMMWFDDALGDQADHMRARWTGRWDWSMAGRFRRHAAALS